MSDQENQSSNSGGPATYHIRLQGHLGDHWRAVLGDVTITLDANGETLLTCTVPDQAALHAILRTVRDLGLPLLEVTRAGGPPAK